MVTLAGAMTGDAHIVGCHEGLGWIAYQVKESCCCEPGTDNYWQQFGKLHWIAKRTRTKNCEVSAGRFLINTNMQSSRYQLPAHRVAHRLEGTALPGALSSPCSLHGYRASVLFMCVLQGWNTHLETHPVSCVFLRTLQMLLYHPAAWCFRGMNADQ